MPDFLDLANKAPLTPALLSGAMEAIADMPEQDRRDMTARMLTIIRFLDWHSAADERQSLGLAINFRLQALARLIAEGGIRGFRHPGAKKVMDWLHEDVIRAAVAVPLRVRDDDAVFDKDEFHDHLLAIASPSGAA